MAEHDEGIIYCSFCGKSEHEVRSLIAGQQAFICDECIALCTDIVRPDDLSSGVADKDKGPRDEKA